MKQMLNYMHFMEIYLIYQLNNSKHKFFQELELYIYSYYKLE